VSALISNVLFLNTYPNDASSGSVLFDMASLLPRLPLDAACLPFLFVPAFLTILIPS
jgi:hypothetical protein